MYNRNSRKIFLSAALTIAACLAAAGLSLGQTPTPSPDSPPSRFVVRGSAEFGVRTVLVNGDHEKYSSDLNYRSGFRVFDSSFSIEDQGPGNKFFDTATVQTSGWGSDPSGSLRFNMSKSGVFKFDSNVRRNSYVNNLKNFAPNWSLPVSRYSEHQFNTKRNFGDFDLTLRPENKKFRMNLGYSFNLSNGPGTYTIRFPQFASSTTTTRGDEFQVSSAFKTRSDDFRVGANGRLLGFNVGLQYGHRTFRDRTNFFLDSFSPGNDPGATTATVTTFQRMYGTRGTTDFANFYVQRTFAKKLDFTGRFIYAESNSNIAENDTGIGTSTASGATIPRVLVDLDQVAVTGKVKRPQTRVDLGMTYRANNFFSISDTFDFDQFSIGGSNRFFETLISRTTAGVPRADDRSDAFNSRATRYRRFTNLVEADFQVNEKFAFHVGYRYSRREVGLNGLGRNLITNVLTVLPTETEKNTTNSFIAGTKFTPVKNWTVFADVEKGDADNVFTRLANNKFVNFRVRSQAKFKDLALNLSVITKDNDNPGESSVFPGTFTVANSKNRYFSASIDWNPLANLSFSSGYTYNSQTTKVDITIPVGAPLVTPTTFFLGKSEFYVRDNFFFFDVTAKPIKRMTLFASYRGDHDRGQGNRFISRPQDIINSYPMLSHSPEVRLAFRITRNIDWNLGYQYYSYEEFLRADPWVFTPFGTRQLYPNQNYTAHLPYTSLRIYFGKGATDR